MENELKQINQIKFRKIPLECKPLCDTLIFNLETPEVTKALLNELNKNNIGTKNVPDAIEWHFATYWDHMINNFDLSLSELQETLKKSSDILSRSIAIPIMVKDTEEVLIHKSKIIKNFFNN